MSSQERNDQEALDLDDIDISGEHTEPPRDDGRNSPIASPSRPLATLFSSPPTATTPGLQRPPRSSPDDMMRLMSTGTGFGDTSNVSFGSPSPNATFAAPCDTTQPHAHGVTADEDLVEDGLPLGMNDTVELGREFSTPPVGTKVGDGELLGTRDETSPSPDLKKAQPAYVHDDDNACPICLEPFEDDNPATPNPCGHLFHLPCLMSWQQRNNTCPMCLAVTGGEPEPPSQHQFDDEDEERHREQLLELMAALMASERDGRTSRELRRAARRAARRERRRYSSGDSSPAMSPTGMDDPFPTAGTGPRRIIVLPSPPSGHRRVSEDPSDPDPSQPALMPLPSATSSTGRRSRSASQKKKGWRRFLCCCCRK